MARGEQTFEESDYIAAAIGINPKIFESVVFVLVSLNFLCNPLLTVRV